MVAAATANEGSELYRGMVTLSLPGDTSVMIMLVLSIVETVLQARKLAYGYILFYLL